jgi:hypothetical protein
VAPLAIGLVVVGDAVEALTGPTKTVLPVVGLVDGVAAVGVRLRILAGRVGVGSSGADTDGPAFAILFAGGAGGLVLGIVTVVAG